MKPHPIFEPRAGRWESLADSIDASGDCWESKSRTTPNGYPQISYRGRLWLVSRLVWTLLVGEIPSGLEIDHLCYNTRCVNPDHLRLVTHSENLDARRWGPGVSPPVTHCRHGHPYDETNTYHTRNGRRACRPCNLAAVKRYQARTL